MRTAGASAAVLRRDRAILFGSAAFLAALAWVAMLRGHTPVEGALQPHAHHGGSSGLALATAMWMVMMAKQYQLPLKLQKQKQINQR